MIGYYNKYPFLLKINNLDRFENCFGIKTGRIKMADFSGYFRLFSVIFEKIFYRASTDVFYHFQVK